MILETAEIAAKSAQEKAALGQDGCQADAGVAVRGGDRLGPAGSLQRLPAARLQDHRRVRGDEGGTRVPRLDPDAVRGEESVAVSGGRRGLSVGSTQLVEAPRTRTRALEGERHGVDREGEQDDLEPGRAGGQPGP